MELDSERGGLGRQWMTSMHSDLCESWNQHNVGIKERGSLGCGGRWNSGQDSRVCGTCPFTESALSGTCSTHVVLDSPSNFAQ